MLSEYDSARGIVFRSRIYDEADDAAAVLEAVGIDSEILPYDDEYLLIVLPEEAFAAADQLRLYLEENPDEPVQPVEEANEIVYPPLSEGAVGVVLYLSVLLLVDGLVPQRPLGLDLSDLGSAKADLIRSGEWWRAATSLTLHADIAHLAGNMACGVVFGLFAAQLLGGGLAWFSILTGGMLGNLASAWFHPSNHLSVGASTAVFSALGIQSAAAWRLRGLERHRGLRRWSPLVGGVILLGLLGGPGERIDAVSHVTGFAAGLGLGLMLVTPPGREARCRGGCQVLLGILALAVLSLSWSAAIGVI